MWCVDVEVSVDYNAYFTDAHDLFDNINVIFDIKIAVDVGKVTFAGCPIFVGCTLHVWVDNGRCDQWLFKTLLSNSDL